MICNHQGNYNHVNWDTILNNNRDGRLGEIQGTGDGVCCLTTLMSLHNIKLYSRHKLLQSRFGFTSDKVEFAGRLEAITFPSTGNIYQEKLFHDLNIPVTLLIPRSSVVQERLGG